MPEHAFDRAARELAESGSSTLRLGPNFDLVLTATDHEEQPGYKLLRSELVTNTYHDTTVTCSMTPILPPGIPWGGGVQTAVAHMWSALGSAIDDLSVARALMEPAVPKEWIEQPEDDEDGDGA